MQTSFMHPPFGFALFYLRSVAPVTVSSGDIYRGAIPFVVIQMVMVGLIIAFPQLVTANLDVAKKVDLDTIRIDDPSPSGYGEGSYPGGDVALPAKPGFDSKR